MTESRSVRTAGIAIGLVAIGQLILAALGPLTRAARAAGGTAGVGGIALLSSDSEYYLDLSAHPMSIGSPPLTRIAFPLLLRLGSALGSAPTFIVLLNLGALILAAMALHDLGQRIGGTSSAGVLAASALVVNPLTAQWARFVLTETLSYCAVVGVVWAIQRFAIYRSWRAALAVVGLAVFITLLRPNGVLVLAAAGGALLSIKLPVTQGERMKRRSLLTLVWFVALLFAIVGSRESDPNIPPTSDVLVSGLYSGVVVEGTPDVLVTTAMPTPVDPEDRSLTAAAGYVIDHPVAAARLGALRIGYETLQLRPHYPTIVNVGMAFGIVVFLGSAAVGARAAPSGTLRRAVLLIGLPQVLLIAATFAVPESRYGWTYLVTLCAWAGIGADRTLRRTRPARGRPSAG